MDLRMLYEMVLRDDCYVKTFKDVTLVLAEPKFCIGYVIIEEEDLRISVPTQQILVQAGL